MSTQQERILVVEGDPAVSDLISRQTLKPLGFQVKVLHDAPRAIQEAKNFYPEIMIVNLSLPGLSGKDLLVALSSQGIKIPVIVIANQGMESDVIQAFRLGASDYIGWPIREAEVVSAVERALIQVRTNRDREQLARKVEKTNRELKSRVRELTTIMGIGKALSSVTDRKTLLEKIIEGAVFMAEGDKGWLLLREGNTKTYNLCAEVNLPTSIANRIDQPWDDGISSLVAISGESLSIHGPPLKLLKISRLGRSALIVPIKNKNDTVGLIVVVRDAPKPFSPSNRSLLEALAEYATIALINSDIFESVENRANSLMGLAEAARKSENVKAEVVNTVHEELDLTLSGILQEVSGLVNDSENPLSKEQTESIQKINDFLKRSALAVEGLDFLQKVHISKNMVTVSLVDLARKAV